MSDGKLSDRATAEAVVKTWALSDEERATVKLTELLAPERAAAKELVRKLQTCIEMRYQDEGRQEALTAIAEWRKIYD